jgi:hypothetical protein
MAQRNRMSLDHPPEMWLHAARTRLVRNRELLQQTAELVARSREQLDTSCELIRIANRQIELGWVPKNPKLERQGVEGAPEEAGRGVGLGQLAGFDE